MSLIHEHPHLYQHLWAIDQRHALVLAHVARALKPDTILEIGAFQGASTVAFLDAVRHGYSERLIIVEPHPTQSLAHILSRGFDNVELWPCRSDDRRVTDLFDHQTCPDMVFIDGDHGKPAIQEMNMCISSRVNIVAMHDTHSIECGFPDCTGSSAAFRRLLVNENYDVIWDNKRREGERTERGLAIGIRNEFASQIPRTLIESIHEVLK